MNSKIIGLRSVTHAREQRQLSSSSLASACPFGKSALTPQSPVRGQPNPGNGQPATVNEINTNDEAACHSEVEAVESPASCREVLSTTPTHTNQSAEIYSLGYNEALKTMGRKLGELKKMMDEKRHVNQQMKSMLSDICKLSKTVESKYTTTNGTITTVTKATQTTAPTVANDKAKRARSLTESDRATNTITEPIGKRSRICSPPTKSIVKDNLLLAIEKNKNIVLKKNSNAESAYVKGPAINQAEEWTKVVKQKRAKSKPMQIFSKIRKTAQGDLLFQLSESSEENTSKLQAAVGQVLGGKSEVKKLTDITQLEIRDIDEVTTHNEICQAVNDLLANVNLEPSNIRSLRKAYGGTQTASVTLPTDWAMKLISIGKIRIGTGHN